MTWQKKKSELKLNAWTVEKELKVDVTRRKQERLDKTDREQ